MTSRPSGPGARDWLLLIALASMWGTAFLFIDVAVAEIPPATVVAGRLSVAAAVLLVGMWAMGRRLPAPGRIWLHFLALGCVGNAAPFLLISWGQQRIDSGAAGLLMGVMPLATLLLAHLFVAGERLTRRRIAGFSLGFAGVAVLVGPEARDALGGDENDTARQAAVLAGALCYAANTVIASRLPPQTPALQSSTCSLLLASGVMVPVSFFQDAPMALSPGPAAVASVIALGVVATALATVVYFAAVARVGPTFVAQINYLIPVIALAAGAAVLGEPVGSRSLAALALIIMGIGFAQGGPRPAA